MAVSNRNIQNAFDFSLDAGDFQKRLWQQLKEKMDAAAIQMLDNDDLEWVNAAGIG